MSSPDVTKAKVRPGLKAGQSNDMHSRKSFGPDPGCRVRGLYFGNARLLFYS